MGLLQILDCNTTLGNCCSSFAIANVLDVTRKVFSIIQIIAPIVLIVMATIQFALMTINPDQKDGNKKILNKFLAAIIIFLLPTFIDIIMGMVPDGINVAACWNEAREIASISSETGNHYVSVNDTDEKNKFYLDKNAVSDKVAPRDWSEIFKNKGNKKVVDYAKRFVGQGYQLNASWNGELPYTKTDCSGFIRGVYKHFGVELTHSCHGMLSDKATRKISENEIQAGDIVVYGNSGSSPGHCAMILGENSKIIHASNERDGIKISDNFRYRKIDFILRVEGVK